LSDNAVKKENKMEGMVIAILLTGISDLLLSVSITESRPTQ
jgi:hypothetical protein